MIQPADKIRLMRAYEINPSSAVLMLADMLRTELKTHMEEMMPKMLAELKKEIPDLEKVLLAVKGADGEDADAEEVAQSLFEMPEFLKITKGEKGDKGEKGETGAQGPKGLQGVQGERGNDGKDGKRGENGTDGAMGPQGAKGKDGSPDKPLEIASKLNTLEEKVDISVIRGLQKLLTDIRGSIKANGGKATKSSGGGMGNWVHQQFSVSSATTTVTLSNNIAANGTAIMVRYQGQLLAHSIQYTIVGKVITLGFTPEDATFVDISYVRK